MYHNISLDFELFRPSLVKDDISFTLVPSRPGSVPIEPRRWIAPATLSLVRM